MTLEQLDAKFAVEEEQAEAKLSTIRRNREMIRKLMKVEGQIELLPDTATHNGNGGHGTGLKAAVIQALVRNSPSGPVYASEVAEWVKAAGFKSIGKHFSTSVYVVLHRLVKSGEAQTVAKGGRKAFQYTNGTS